MAEASTGTSRVGIRELRQNLSVYVRRIHRGERFEVTERGRPVALLVPLADALSREAPGGGGDDQESWIEALYQAATGHGWNDDGVNDDSGSGDAGRILTQRQPGQTGDVPKFSSFAEALDQADDIHLRVIDVDNITALTLNQEVAGSLTTNYFHDFYQFAGQRQQTLTISPVNLSADVTWSLYDPADRLVMTGDLSQSQNVLLLGDGTYVLALGTNSASTTSAVSYSFQAALVDGTPAAPPTATSISPNVDVVNNLPTQSVDYYEFELAQDSKLFFNNLTGSNGISLILLSASEAELATLQYWGDNGDSEDVWSLAAGRYRLQITNGSLEPYSFQLVDLLSTSVTSVNSDATVTIELTDLARTKLIRVDASAGDLFKFDFSPSPNVRTRVVDPFGKTLEPQTQDISQAFSAGISSLKATVDGAYFLVFEADVLFTPFTGNLVVDYVGNVPEPPLTSDVLPVGGQLDEVLLHRQRREFVVNAAPGQRLIVDGMVFDDLTVHMHSPGNVAVYSNVDPGFQHASSEEPSEFGPASGHHPLLYTVSLAGNHRVTIEPPDYSAEGPGTLGGVGFRPNAIPIILAATDNQSVVNTNGLATITGLNGVQEPATDFSTDARLQGYGASVQETVDALLGLGALVVGLGSPDATDPRPALEAMARLTGAVNSTNVRIPSGFEDDFIEQGEPIYFHLPGLDSSVAADRITDGIEQTLRAVKFDINLVANPVIPAINFHNITGVQPDVPLLEDISFEFSITGDGNAHEFDLEFIREGTGAVLGRAPVALNFGYLYDVDAQDPDLVDAARLRFAFLTADNNREQTDPATGAQIDPVTGRMAWLPEAAGDYTFTVEVIDQRGGSETQTWTVTVEPAAPAITTIADQQIAEDATTGPISFLVDDIDTPLDSLTISAVSSNTDLVPNSIVNIELAGEGADRTIQITPAPDQHGEAIITVTVSDGQKSTSTNFTVTVNSVNDDPTTSNHMVTLLEDETFTFVANDFPFSDVDVGDELAAVTIVTLPSAGALKLNGSAVVAGQPITKTELDAQLLTYEPLPDENGQPYTTFTFNVSDGAAASTTATMSVEVTPINDAPIASNHTVALSEDTTYPFAASDFQFLDVDTGDALTAVTIVSLPAVGALKLNGAAVVVGQPVSKAELDAQLLTFEPLSDASGQPYTTFTFNVSDGSLASNTATMTVDVTPVNDAPTLNAIADETIDEDAIEQTVNLAGITAGGGESQPLQVTATSDNPSLIPNPAVAYTSPESTGTLTYIPNPNQNGSAVITVTVTDGGLDGDLTTTADNGSFSQSFTVTVNAVPDPPVISAIADQTIDEDADTGEISLHDQRSRRIRIAVDNDRIEQHRPGHCEWHLRSAARARTAPSRSNRYQSKSGKPSSPLPFSKLPMACSISSPSPSPLRKSTIRPR